MRKGGRTRAAVLAASSAGHVLILAALAATRGSLPALMTPPPVMQVQIAPAYIVPAQPKPQPQAAKRPKPSPHTRTPAPHLARLPAEDAPVAPLFAPAAPRSPAGLDGGVRAALRDGPLGCANPEALGLDKRARARCLERLGAGATEAPFIPAPLSKEKQAAFDRAAARKEADRKYREAPIPPGLSTSDAPGGITGLGQTGHGSVPFP